MIKVRKTVVDLKLELPLLHDVYAAALQSKAARNLFVSDRRVVLPGIILLVLAVATDRYGITLGGLNLRFELIIGGILALYYLFRGGIRALRDAGIIEWCILAWLAVSFISSLVFSPVPQHSLKLTVLVAGFVVLYGVGFMLLRSAREVIWAAMTWIAVGVAVALTGLIEALLFIGFKSTAGITLENNYQQGLFTVTPKVHSTLWEPNLFGSYCLTVAMLAAALSCAPAFRSTRMQYVLRIATASAFCGAMLSMTRTVWVVAPVLLIVLSLGILWLKIASWRQMVRIVVMPALVGMALGLTVGYLMPTASVKAVGQLSAQQIEQVRSVLKGESTSSGNRRVSTDKGSAITDRVTGFSAPDEVSSYVGRKRIFALAFHGWLERPLLGWGTGSFAYYDTGGDKWIGNLELHILFDTGIVGFLLLSAAAVVAVWRSVRLLRLPAMLWDTTRFAIFGLLVGSFGLFLTYQLTAGTWLGFTWVFFAIQVAAARYAVSSDGTQLVDNA